MRQQNLIVLVPLLLGFAGPGLTSCMGNEQPPPIVFDPQHLNREIALEAPAFFNDFKTASSVGLKLRSDSPNEIVFPTNYDLRVFSRTDSGWDEIGEKPTERYPPGEVIFPPAAAPATRTVTLFPNLPDERHAYNLRIYVFGEMKTQSQQVPVAAFVDVLLHP